MFHAVDDLKASKSNFLQDAQKARQTRAAERKHDAAAIQIQAAARGFISRRRMHHAVRARFDAAFADFHELNKSADLKPITQTFPLIRQMIYCFRPGEDKERFLRICRYILISVEKTDPKLNFAALTLSKDSLSIWFNLMKQLLWKCCIMLEGLQPDLPNDTKHINLLLHVLVSFTSCNSWSFLKASKQADALKPSLNQLCSNIVSHLVSKGFYKSLQNLMKRGLCRSNPLLKSTTVSAVISLSLRPLMNMSFNDDIMTRFIQHILSIPGLIYHLNETAQECVALFMTHKLFARSLIILSTEANTRQIFATLEGSYSLCLLANLIHLGSMDKTVLVGLLFDFTNVVTRLLEKCRQYVVSKKSAMTHWHPVLGWFSQSTDTYLHASMSHVAEQLQLLWSADVLKCLFADLIDMLPELPAADTIPSSSAAAFSKIDRTSEFSASVRNLFRKIMEQRNASGGASSSGQKALKKFGTPETTVVALVCTLYQNALATLSQLKLDILSGLCYQDFLLPRLWHFISQLGSANGLKAYLELLSLNPKATAPEFQILILFCEASTYLLTILDDVELYDQQKPFSGTQLNAIAAFLNQLVFKSVWDGTIDVKSAPSHSLFQAAHNLLILLYNRDCRRAFTAYPDFWLIKEVKAKDFVAAMDKNNERAEFLLQKAPHIIPHKERVVLFRKYVQAEKQSLGLETSGDHLSSSTLITVHRSRIVEDGYRQLSLLPLNALKGVIRVKFINEQGLDEAGIDQDGVFKEFLEETIKRVFNPSLNLFKETSEGRLYPSPTSNVHENHLALFDFVGRILGKAIYEGIVVEVPFATFFLNHLLGRSNSLTYSSFDELPSLDAELYKNLTFLKHYDGNVADLELTFSCLEDYIGQPVAHELIPGGKVVSVTNENKISYVHLMAHFRMYTQIKDQLQAFTRGFRALLNPTWLQLFSAPELQKLISGDTEDIDLDDLRKHTQYYGGFHNSHRVITWLWDILQNEFTPEERKLFLRFVTSCSKPPLLGFAYLEPQFSIRCVEVSEDQDEGDTLGSVIRGFLAIRTKRDPIGRLPTSSTCFNLLKLPNYQRKSTLRDKLKYAIRQGLGFELS